MGWDDARKQALKILGDGADVPELPPAASKADTEFEKAEGEFMETVEACQDKLLAVDNANSGVINAAEQLRGKIEKNDFQLDAKKEAKKIAQARKILCAAIDDRIKDSKVIDKAVGELTKHLSQLAKYRS